MKATKFDESDHPEFPRISDTLVLWRYMDFMKFISLVDKRALYFTRADRMEDRWEGTYGAASAIANAEALGEHYAAMWPQLLQNMSQLRKQTYLNCWHESLYESAAMWGIYQGTGQGIAIRTTWRKLKDSIISDWDIYGGKVKYIDYDKIPINSQNYFTAYLHKRQSFAHEKELRLILWAADSSHPRGLNVGEEGPPAIEVSADLDTLIDKIYVAPSSPSWQRELLESVLSRYGFSWSILQSDIDNDPLV